MGTLPFLHYSPIIQTIADDTPTEHDKFMPTKMDLGFLERIIDAIADPVFVKDESHRWQLLNQAFCELMGRPREELLGRSDHDFFSKEEADVFQAMDDLVLQTGKANVNEELITDGDGTSRIIVTKKSAFHDKSGRRFLVGAIRDVTEIKQTQHDLMLAQLKLEALLEERTAEAAEAQKLLLHCQKMDTLGELAGGIAHDFNNLLAVISASLEFIVRNQQQNGAANSVGNVALEAVGRGTALTRRLLEFSRPHELDPQPIEISSIVRDVELLLARTLGSSIALSTKVDDASLVVSVDHAQMEAAVLNLCVNARNAMPNGGMIKLRVERQEVDVELARTLDLTPGAYALVEVADEGVGMTPEVMARAFEAFYTTRRDGKGTGLGLSMVKAFATKARGAVHLASVEGEGTTLGLYLPLSTMQETQEPTASRPLRVPKRDLALLVVDDDAHLQAVLTRSLQMLGYDAFGASSAHDARQVAAARTKIDVLVTDTLIRDPSSPSLVDEVTKLHPGLRVVFITGDADDETVVQRASQRGAPVLQKPFRLANLDEAIQTSVETGSSTATE